MEYRYLNDMLSVFNNTTNITDNPLIYSFDNIIPYSNEEELLYGKTIIQPGNINDEFYMTKGHIHNIPCAEVYYGIKGNGIVLCQKEDQMKEFELCADKVVYCEPEWAHRVINTSHEPLEFLCVCKANA